MRNQDYRAGNLTEGRGKVDEEPLSGPKRRNQDRAAVGGNLPGGQGKTEEGMPLPGADSIMGSRAQFFKRLTKILDDLGFGIAYFSQPRSLLRPNKYWGSGPAKGTHLRPRN